jgi:hypothetical protein
MKIFVVAAALMLMVAGSNLPLRSIDLASAPKGITEQTSILKQLNKSLPAKRHYAGWRNIG